MAPKHPGKLRFAIAMRGGVSLSVWIGGAVAEVDRLRRAKAPQEGRGDQEPGDQDPFAERLLEIAGFSTVEVDVLSGASAGGLNAAFASMAIARGSPLSLKPVWLDVADIDCLLNHGTPEDSGLHHRRSVLNGDYFLDEVTERLRGLQTCTTGRVAPATVDAFLAVTVFDGVTVTNPLDPSYHDRRSGAYFHFRHDGDNQAVSHFLAPEAPDRLGEAARASASFPVAFEPVKVRRETSVGTLRLPTMPSVPPSGNSGEISLYDGGIVDNIPVARVIDAVGEASSDEAVRRWVLFLHPSPTVEGQDDDKSGSKQKSGVKASRKMPTVVTVIKDFLGAKAQETLLDDLDVLRDHNRDVEAYMVQRYSLCQAAFASQWRDGSSIRSLGSIDAYRLYATLEDPARNTSYTPTDKNPPLSPLASQSGDQRFQVRMDLLDKANASDTPLRPYASVARQCQLLIEWARWLEGLGANVQQQTRVKIHDVLTVAKMIDSMLDRHFVESYGQDMMEELLARLQRIDHSAKLVTLARSLGEQGGNRWSDPLVDRLTNESREIYCAIAEGVVPTAHHVTGSLTDVLRQAMADTGLALAKLSFVDDVLTQVVVLFHPDMPFAADLPLVVELKSHELKVLPQQYPTKPSLFTLLVRNLGPEPTRQEINAALDSLDVATAGLHRGRTTGAPQSLDYLRISGARGSPLADATFMPEVKLHFPDGSGLLQGLGDEIDPTRKLSGNTLANFSAFFSRRFRANDWMWGRMDAASGLVEVLLRPEQLCRGCSSEDVDALVEKVRELVTSPLAIVDTDESPAPSNFDIQLTELMQELWNTHHNTVHTELAKALNGVAWSDSFTAKLITLRWHLEIMLSELGAVFASQLHPADSHHASFSLDAPDIDEADRVKRAVAPFKKMLDEYSALPRRISSLWGRTSSTALSVKIVRHTVGALFPMKGLQPALSRVLLGAPLLIIVAAVVQPTISLITINALFVFVGFSHLAATARWIVVVVALALSVGFWWFVVRRSLHRYRWWPLAVCVLLQAFSLVGLGPWKHVGPNAAATYRAPQLYPQPSNPFQHLWDKGLNGIGASAICVGVVVLASVLALWWWAKRPWRIGVAAVAALTMMFWAVVGSWTSPKQRNPAWGFIRSISSPVFPTIAIILGAVSVALHFTPEKRPIGVAPITPDARPESHV